MEIKSPNKAWDLTTYWHRKYKIDKYNFDLKDSFFIATHVFPFSIKMNNLFNIIHRTLLKDFIIPCLACGVEENTSLTGILPDCKSAHTDDPEIHLNFLGTPLLEASWRLGGHEWRWKGRCWWFWPSCPCRIQNTFANHTKTPLCVKHHFISKKLWGS